jgi:hypothetical protein
MALIAKNEGGNFELPTPGMAQGVISSIVDMGLQPTAWGDKQKVALVWETNRLLSTGERWVTAKMYTLSLNEKAFLRKDIEAICGIKLTKEQVAAGFDVETLRGKSCFVNIAITEDGDKKYAEIQTYMPLPDGTPALQPMGLPVPAWITKKMTAAASSVDAGDKLPF